MNAMKESKRHNRNKWILLVTVINRKENNNRQKKMLYKKKRLHFKYLLISKKSKIMKKMKN